MSKKEDLKSIFSIHNPFISDELLDQMEKNFEARTFKKGDLIVSEKGICQTCYFVIDGYVRSYFCKDDMEYTFWFGEKGDLLTSYHTLFNKTNGNENIVALCNCTVYAIDLNLFKSWIKSSHEVALIYIKIIESGYQYWENRFAILTQMNVEKRYSEWLSRTKHLAPYVPLGVLAQYLNINQATLSRIRAKQKLE